MLRLISSKELTRKVAFLGLLAILLQFFVPIVHGLAGVSHGQGVFSYKLLCLVSDKSIGQSDQGKHPLTKDAVGKVCSICQTINLLWGSGLAPEVTTPLFKANKFDNPVLLAIKLTGRPDYNHPFGQGPPQID